MEILLIACMLAYAAGAQSEQSKLGLSPAQRAAMKEQARHEKAIQRIKEKHGGSTPSAQGASPWKEPTDPKGTEGVPPDTFLSGYRTRRPIGDGRPAMGHRAGVWAAQGVTWAQGTGRGAWQAYRKRRTSEGYDDPGVVLIPLPPAHPPTVGATAEPEPAKKPERAEEQAKPVDTAKPAEEPATTPTAKQAPAATVEATEDPAPQIAQPAAAEPTETATADPQGGTGRMAAEVTYESVIDESDELSLMCEDDVRVYDRIRIRAEREIGRGDDLIVSLQNAGFGNGVIGWVGRCMEQYRMIRGQLDDLEANTITQGEKVAAAKALLEAGQGVYADIAKDMESVAERESYISDAVDSEDTSAHTEIYETKAA